MKCIVWPTASVHSVSCKSMKVGHLHCAYDLKTGIEPDHNVLLSFSFTWSKFRKRFLKCAITKNRSKLRMGDQTTLHVVSQFQISMWEQTTWKRESDKHWLGWWWQSSHLQTATLSYPIWFMQSGLRVCVCELGRKRERVCQSGCISLLKLQKRAALNQMACMQLTTENNACV